MLVHTGNVDKALTITQDALTKYPDHAHEFHMRRGLIYESMNNLHAARVPSILPFFSHKRTNTNVY